MRDDAQAPQPLPPATLRNGKAVPVAVGAIVVLVLLGLFIAALRSRRWQVDRLDMYLCRSCGAERWVVTKRRFGIVWSRTQRVKATALSQRIADATGIDCQHDWHFAWFFVSSPRGRGHAHGSLSLLEDLKRLTATEEIATGIVRFAGTTNRSPQEVWRTLLQYMYCDAASAELYFGLTDEGSRGETPFGVWLEQNYDQIVEELEKPTPKPTDRNEHGDPEAGSDDS